MSTRDSMPPSLPSREPSQKEICTVSASPSPSRSSSLEDNDSNSGIKVNSVSIRPHDFYKHYIYVEEQHNSTTREPLFLQWAWREQRSRGLAFGLFYLYDGHLPRERVLEALDQIRSNLSNLARFDGGDTLTPGLGMSRSMSGGGSMDTLTLNEDTVSVTTPAAVLVGDMIEILPIQRTTGLILRGVLRVDTLPGTWVLYFDNSYPGAQHVKHLVFAVTLVKSLELNNLGLNETMPSAVTGIVSPSAIEETRQQQAATVPVSSTPLSTEEEESENEVVLSGWLLKRKRRRLPGWSKRWFVLYRNSSLSYYETPEGPCRGQVLLIDCTLSKVPAHRLLIIDSGTMVFHLKTDSEKQFREWADALTAVRRGYNLMSMTGTTNTNLPSSSPSAQAPSIELLGRQLTEARLQIQKLQDEDQSTRLVQLLEILDTVYSGLAQWAVQVQSNQTQIQVSGRSGEVTIEVPMQTPSILIQQGQANLPSTSASSLDASDTEQFFDVQEWIEGEDLTSSVAPLVMTSASSALISATPSPPPRQRPALSTSTILPSLMLPSELPMIISITWPLITQRRALPAVAPKFAGLGMFQMLNAVRTGSAPTEANEPLNTIQRLAEELEYSELLDKAALLGNPGQEMDQLVAVTCFAISGYSSSAWRADRKPFNPMLGETFDLECPSRGFRFIGEKVQHKPYTIIACYAESIGKGLVGSSSTNTLESDSPPGSRWSWSQDIGIKEVTPIGQKSIPLTPIWGSCTLLFPSSGDRYTWTKVETHLRDAMSSSRWVEHVGMMELTNEKTGATAVITFKERGTSRHRNQVIAELSHNSTRYILKGRWDESLLLQTDPGSRTLKDIWHVNALPPNYLDFYGFTWMAMSMNDLEDKHLVPEQGALPKTDTRFRPDQRLVEHRRLERADEEKRRIEERQRATRKIMEERGERWKPRWFNLRNKETIDENGDYAEMNDSPQENSTGSRSNSSSMMSVHSSSVSSISSTHSHQCHSGWTLNDEADNNYWKIKREGKFGSKNLPKLW